MDWKSTERMRKYSFLTGSTDVRSIHIYIPFWQAALMSDQYTYIFLSDRQHWRQINTHIYIQFASTPAFYSGSQNSILKLKFSNSAFHGALSNWKQQVQTTDCCHTFLLVTSLEHIFVEGWYGYRGYWRKPAVSLKQYGHNCNSCANYFIYSVFIAQLDKTWWWLLLAETCSFCLI
jgi:hypothetical protein